MKPLMTGVPWRFWAIFLAVGITLVVAYRLFPPSFEHSFPQLEFHDDSVTVAFNVTNHGYAPVTKKISIAVVAAHPGSKARKPTYITLDHKEMTVSLSPSETKPIRCEFLLAGRGVPNTADITVLQ